MPKRTLQDELGALKAQMEASAPAATETVGDRARAGQKDAGQKDHEAAPLDIKAQIDELLVALSDVTEDAEAGIKRYPLASVGAAFALGLILGRATGGRS